MWTLKEAFVKSTGAGSSMRFDRLDTSFDPLRVVVDGRDFDVTARPGRVLRQLIAADVDPEQQGIPVG